ncbi:DNA-processing protein DprA [Candidatus Woesearchaeota archaeon]|nr:DNA-processing protein DprA [Candidatus Woesearchaeota archaeon]
MFDDQAKRESFYHAALIETGLLKIASPKANNQARELLQQHGSFEGIACAQKLEDRLKNDRDTALIRRQLERWNKPFQVLTINDLTFPELLKKVEGITPVLYLQGDPKILNAKSVAIVGTRDLEDSIDREEGERIVKEVVHKGYVVVSGLANGCDTLAHQETIAYGGRTIAVLGTPLNRTYPAKNKQLQEDIAENHLVVSQYPMGISTFPHHFAHRNTTTVGLSSLGIIVIRAGDRSGTLHAVEECLKQGKQLFVLHNNLGKGYKWIEHYRGKFKIPNPPRGLSKWLLI